MLSYRRRTVPGSISSEISLSSPGGWIEEGIRSWAKRVDIGVIVDGTEVYAQEESHMIRRAAEELGIDYFRIRSAVDVDFTHTNRCSDAADIVKDASYTVRQRADDRMPGTGTGRGE